MNVLITGVGGLIGSRLAEFLIKQKSLNVLGIDNFSGGYMENVPKEVYLITGDCNGSYLGSILEKNNINIVYHCAAYAAEGLSPFIRKYNYENNLLATANIVNGCINHQVDRLVFFSSMATYGEGAPPFDESDRCAPIDPYGVAKYAAEMDIQIAGEQHDLDWCIIRPHNIYGKNQNIWDKYRNVLGIWMNQKLNNKPMTIFGDGLQKRAFSYIDDCLEPLYQAGFSDKASREIINLGGIHETTINDACATLCEVAGGSDVVYLEGRHEVKEAWPTYQKSIDLLGFQHRTDLKNGLEQMWDWAKVQPKRPTQDWINHEVTKNIYEFWKK